MQACGAVSCHAEALDPCDLTVRVQNLIWLLRRNAGVSRKTKAKGSSGASGEKRKGKTNKENEPARNDETAQRRAGCYSYHNW